MSDVSFARRRIDNQEQLIARVGYDEVVENPPVIIGQNGVPRLAGLSPSIALGTNASRARAGSSPFNTSCPICETSKSAAAARQCLCSVTIPVGYSTGSDQPAKSTILPPR